MSTRASRMILQGIGLGAVLFLFFNSSLSAEESVKPAQAQPPEVLAPAAKEAEPLLTLEEALQQAQKANPEIHAAEKVWQQEQAMILATRTWPDPQLGWEKWGSNETWYDISQTIPFPGKLALKAKAQAHEARRQHELYEAKQKEILQKVKAAYYGYFLARRELEIFRESAELLKHFTTVAQNRYAVNQASQMDVLKAQVEYSKLQNTLVTLEQEQEVAAADLNALLDRTPDMPLGKPAEPGLPSMDLNYPELESIALANRPELHAAHHHVDHMNAELWASRADFLPDTMVQYSRRMLKDAPDDNIIMVKFNVPLWFWGKEASVKAAQRAKEGAQAELRSEETMTRADLKSILVKTQTARRLVELYKTSVIPQAQASLRAASAGYEAGSAGFLDLLDGHRSWLEFQMEYYQYLAQYWSYLAALERVVGKDLVPTTAQTDMAAHS